MDENKNIYNLTQEEIFEKFSTDLGGISDEEAKKRLLKYGPNKIKEKYNWNWIYLIFRQFNSALIWILLVGAGLTFAVGEYRDMAIILIIVFLNALIGFIQEFKSERILAQIKKLVNDRAIVYRNEKKDIDVKQIVPGDIVFLYDGDKVPADGYLVESFDLYVNDFIFTGESRPHHKKSGPLSGKNLLLAEMRNMVFTGSTVTRGAGKFVVTATGMESELGRIANLTAKIKDSETPLQKRMKSLSRDVAILSFAIGILVIIAGNFSNFSWYQNFLFALALSVSVVPEGLPAALSVGLSMGMKKLLKHNVLVKKLNAVETLGSVSVICTDKTGTITRNELMVTKVVAGASIFDIDGEGYEPKGNFYSLGNKIDPKSFSDLEMLFKIGTLCSSSSLRERNGDYKIIGDPTEGAIIVAAKKYNSDFSVFRMYEEKMAEIPFSSERMKMSVIYRNKKTGKVISFVKGSPDVLFSECANRLENGVVRPFSEGEKQEAKRIYNSMSSQALRVLAHAYVDLTDISQSEYLEKAEKNLTFVGLVAMIDHPRKDADKAIQECVDSGIKVIMITGDYEVTAKAIAQKVGLIDDDGEVISGKLLNNLSDEEVLERIDGKNAVFARITPEQKLRIASILRNAGIVIAMTGDGVNDSLALKKADIGVAMGKIGTDVAKEASDMILLDDNFVSIVKGIKEGRTIYSNIKKFIHYVFTSDASEFFTIIIGVILQIPAPITAIQILAIDLGTDVFPSLALGIEPPEPNIMKEKPNNVKERLIDSKGFIRLINLGLIMATGAIIAFLWSMIRGGWQFGQKIDFNSLLYIKSTSAAYAVLAMSQMANLMQSRSQNLSPFKIGFFKNKFAIVSIFISIFILLAFMYVPFISNYLHMRPIDFIDWIVVIIAVLAVFFFEEARKNE